MAIDQIPSGLIKDNAVTTVKILDDNITAAKIVAGAVVADIANGGVATAKLADDAVTQAKMGAGAIGTTELAADAVDGTKLADNAVNSEHVTAGAIDTAHVGDDQITGAKIENNPSIAGNLTVSGNTSLTGDLVPSTPLSHRNTIINGAMNVNQRSTRDVNVTGHASGVLNVDRFYVNQNGLGSIISRQQSITDLEGFQNCFRIRHDTQQGSVGAGDQSYITYKVEAQDMQRFVSTTGTKPMVLSFYAKCDATYAGKYYVYLQAYDASNRNLSFDFTTTTSWQRFEFAIPADSSGVYNYDNGTGIEIRLMLAAGSTYVGGNAETWGADANNRKAGADIKNPHTTAVATTQGFFLTGVQLELGSSATPYEHRKYSDALTECHRYCVVFGNGSNGAASWMVGGASNSASSAYFQYRLPVVPRAIPTLSIVGQIIFSDNWASDHTTTANVSTQPQVLGIQGRVYLTGMSGLTAQRVYGGPNGLGGTGKTIFTMDL